jgi:hypothetical protein
MDAAVVALLVAKPKFAVLLAIVPFVLILLAWVGTGDRSWLVLGAIVTTIGPTNLSNAIGHSGGKLYLQDALVALALAGWIIEGALAAREKRERPRRVILGWSAVVFAAAILSSLIRGHVAWGASYFGQPLRFVIYAGIGAAIVHADPAKLYRRLTTVLYAGIVWQLIAAAYHIATGTSQSGSADLSTGGYRTVSIQTSLFVASALYIAILNLERREAARARALDFSVIVLSLVLIVLAFSRGTFIAVAFVLLAFFFSLPRARSAFFQIAPLALPLFIAGALFLPRVHTHQNQPSLVQTLIQRLDPRVNNDLSVQWRHQADTLLWQQVKSNPLFGVGFGEEGDFTLANVQYHITQDAHNDYLFLLAAGGFVLLAAFLAIVGLSFLHYYQVVRGAPRDEPRRLLAVWAMATGFTLFFNGLVEPLIVQPPVLLTLWIVFLLPLILQRSFVPALVARPAAAGIGGIRLRVVGTR